MNRKRGQLTFQNRSLYFFFFIYCTTHKSVFKYIKKRGGGPHDQSPNNVFDVGHLASCVLFLQHFFQRGKGQNIKFEGEKRFESKATLLLEGLPKVHLILGYVVIISSSLLARFPIRI